MTIEELYNFLGKFIEEHPKCKNKPIMVKSLKDDTTWEEVTTISDTIVEACPQHGSPLYFHSPSQEAAAQRNKEKQIFMDDDDDYYM